MRVHRVYLHPLKTGAVLLRGRDAHHLKRVLRVMPGQAIRAFDGRGLEADGVVREVEENQVELELAPPRQSSAEAAVDITLAIALLKGDKLSDIVRMATELGVREFKPIVSKHCDVKVLSEAKLERLRRVAQEAAKQSGRSFVPDIEEAVKLSQLPIFPLTLVAHPYTPLTLNEITAEGMPSKLTLITGPEGGLSDDEVETLVAKGAIAVRLGARILRAETAPLALAAALLVPEAL